MAPSVESMAMKLFVFLGSEVPALTRSSVLMLKLRCAPQGAQTNWAQSVVSVACQLLSSGPLKRWVPVAVSGEPWK